MIKLGIESCRWHVFSGSYANQNYAIVIILIKCDTSGFAFSELDNACTLLLLFLFSGGFILSSGIVYSNS